LAAKQNRFYRKFHHWCSIVIALPLLIILITGMLLLLKKQVSWIQPATMRGQGESPELTFEQIIEIATTVPEAQIDTWDDIDRLDVRPSKGVIKIRAKNNWEIQIDHRDGTVLQSQYRRSDIIENIHDGSFFYEAAKPWMFLAAAAGFLLLWITGMYLFIITRKAKARNNLKASS
jgi:uncharacterized iron-regulated membrane protein